MTHDISRSAHDPKKHYASALFQQGRIPLDDDLNEADAITKEDERLTRVDVIGPAGSPDDGFLIENAGSTITMRPGTMYVGGIRVVLEEKELFLEQFDILPPDHPDMLESGVNLVFLEVWQQIVTAVEDTELLEPALGGPDTSVRLRTMHRIRCIHVDTNDCEIAWKAFVDRWPPGEFDITTNELRSSARLSVDFDTTGASQNACSPGVKAGYLGAENQTIRVQITEEQNPKFLWGFDNASSLYRAHVQPITENGVTRAEIFIPPPKDEEHWPRTGQTIELLGAIRALPNKSDAIAELDGPILPVFRSYNPTTGSFVIDVDPTGKLVGEGFVRVWNQGDASSLEQAIVPNAPIKLGNTGVVVTFQGSVFRKSDHWIIGVRPETDHVIPRDLFKNGRAPNGVRRFYAPLGLVTFDGTNVTAVHDCRPTFDPLTTRTGCCTYTVGSKRKGAGHYDTIQDAVNNLPDDGGEICVLAGEYKENVTIEGKSKVRIHGCGPRTIIIRDNPQLPAFSITGSSISISKFAFESIEAQSSAPTIFIDQIPVAESNRLDPSTDIELRDLSIHIRGGSAVMANHVDGLRIVDVDVAMASLGFDIDKNDSDLGAYPAVAVSGKNMLIEQIRIDADEPSNLRQHPFGGIQIGGDSEKVQIRRCFITSGRGNGITLGDLMALDVQSNIPIFRWFRPDIGIKYIIDDSGCLGWIPPPPPTGGDSPGTTDFVAGCPLRDIQIVDNEIHSMGLSGIAVVRLFPPIDVRDFGEIFRSGGSLGFSPGAIETHDLSIEGNRIFDCVQLHMNSAPQGPPYLAMGGIILADASGLVIRDNDIERNGAAHDDPSCGIYVTYGEEVVIERNRIMDNGPDHWPHEWAHFRGGIVVTAGALRVDSLLTNVVPTTFTNNIAGLQRFAPEQRYEAARVCDNIVVSPLGPALDLISYGASFVHGNNLASRGGFPARPLARSEAKQQPHGQTSNFELGGAAVSAVAMFHPIYFYFVLAGGMAPEEIGRGADLLFDSNVVTYQPLDEVRPYNIAFLGAYDDVACLDNRFTSVGATAKSATVFATAGFSMRVSNNRVREPNAVAENYQLSMLTFAPMNQTTSNQSDHCIYAVGLSLYSEFDNRSKIQCTKAIKDAGTAGALWATGPLAELKG